MAEQKNKGGRPRKAAEPGERVGLSLRVPAELKTKLDAQATQTGRSLSQEAELRLENSFGEEDRWGGAEVRQTTAMLATTFNHAGKMAAERNGVGKDWTKDPGCYQTAMFAVIHALFRDFPSPDDDERAELIRLLPESLKGQLLTNIARRKGNG